MIDDPEIAALNTAYTALKGLEPDAIARNLNWLATRLGVTPLPKTPSVKTTGGPPAAELGGETPVEPGEQAQNGDFAKFQTTAEFLTKIGEPTNEERVLAVAAYIQQKQPEVELTGFAINKELKHIGHGLSNITRAISFWVNQRPQLMIQLRKSGTTKQAKKTFKVTEEGLKKVRSMVDGNTEA